MCQNLIEKIIVIFEGIFCNYISWFTAIKLPIETHQIVFSQEAYW